MIERNVDYLQISVSFPQNKCRERGWKIIPPVPFYKIGYQDENGVRYYYGNPNSKKALCICGGFALQSLREHGSSDGQICDNFAKLNATCSRVDLAITEYIEAEFVTLSDVEGWFRDGKIKSAHTSGGCKEILAVPQMGEKAIQTLYIGELEKRGSRGIFRAYDKGVEMDLEPFLITRLEIEDRGDKAMATFKRIADTNDVAGNFRARFDVDDPEFERLMQAPVADTTRGQNLQKRSEIELRNGRWYWLINQVAPALKQAMKDDEELQLGDEMLTKFLTNSGLQALMRATAIDLGRKHYYDFLRQANLVDE